MGDLVAVLTAVGVSIYVLGLIGLAIPLRRITKDFQAKLWSGVELILRPDEVEILDRLRRG